jgi:uncharacterized protein (TIGR03083 family)
MSSNAPSYAELVTAIRREGEGIRTAAELGGDAEVPTCDGWSMTDLVEHVTRFYLRVTRLVGERMTEPDGDWPTLPRGDLVAVFSDALDGLIATLQDATADTTVWNWAYGERGEAAFWARRAAHESSVHRYDAQKAHGVVQPIDAELATDGLDELVDVLAPRIYARDEITSGPVGSVALSSSDDGSWCLELDTSSVRRLDVLSQPTVTVRGTSSALLLATYSRAPWSSLDTEGDVSLVEAWTAAMNF